MPNIYVETRLRAVLDILRASHKGGADMSAASKGIEREAFVKHCLANVIAPPFRTGTGDITDLQGNHSGQLDVVIEYGNSASFPMPTGCARLYLAEGVCAVVEVKSNLSAQWDEVVASHAKLSPIRRAFTTAMMTFGEAPANHVPHIAVGYEGWQKPETIEQKLKESGLDGILIISSGIYMNSKTCRKGSWSILGFFDHITQITSSMVGQASNSLRYSE